MRWPEENFKGSKPLVYQEVVLKKNCFILTARMRDTWHENVIGLNNANHVERLDINRILIQISDTIDVMK